MGAKVSVVCPTYNEERHIRHCIESILSQDFPKSELEILFVDGMSSDRTREIIAGYITRYPYIRLLDNPNRIAPWAMNIGIEASCGDIVIRLDAHASYAPNYFSYLVNRLIELEADNVGSVCVTDVRVRNPKTLAIREVLRNRFGVGNSIFRIGVDKVCEVDTVPFGCWKRDVFRRYGLFDVRLVRNQDIEFNRRITRGGGKIYIVPDTYCTYYARETFRALSKQGYLNGKWNIFTVWYERTFHTLSVRHFIPLSFVLSLVLPLLLLPFWAPLALVSAASLLAYAFLMVTVCARLHVAKQLSFIHLIMSFAILHFSYGLGALAGIFTLPFIRR